jgi:hypothetical protein
MARRPGSRTSVQADQVVLSEYDQAGALLASYTAGAKGGSSAVQVRASIDSVVGRARINVLAEQNVRPTKPAWEQLVDVFLPAGYPASVTDDYLS